jgi:hypothetical protein
MISLPSHIQDMPALDRLFTEIEGEEISIMSLAVGKFPTSSGPPKPDLPFLLSRVPRSVK